MMTVPTSSSSVVVNNLTFASEISIDGGTPDSSNMPDNFSGEFVTFEGINEHVAAASVQSVPSSDGSSRKIWLNGKRDGYTFCIDPPGRLRFRAVSMRVNPLTGKKGFQR